MGDTPAHLARIRAHFPDVDPSQVEANADGLMNDVYVLGGRRVVRFAKDDWARACLAKEARILDLARAYVSLRLPALDLFEDDMASYELIPGTPLYRSELLLWSQAEQDRLAQQLGTFLHQLHAIPPPELERCAIPVSDASPTRESCLSLYEEAERDLFPHMSSYVRGWVQRHFAPLFDGSLAWDHAPALIHGDLGPWHLLCDEATRRLTAVIDFGVAGLGDPAMDLSIIVDVLGESFMRRMAPYYPGLGAFIDRARFLAGLGMGWVMRGLSTGNPRWHTLHLSVARDVMPVGAPWP